MDSFGDAIVGARAWIFKPESGDNISVGMDSRFSRPINPFRRVTAAPG